MDLPDDRTSAAPGLRTLLDLDRTLSPSDRKVLECLLLRGRAQSARELSRGTGTNLQALYGALDRLERRGFVARDRTGGTTRFRSAHPSVILHTLLEPGKRAAALAADLEAPLRRIHETDGGPPAEEPSGPAASTASPTAATSWLLDLIGDAVGEVWFLGDESAWFAPGASVDRELTERRRRSNAFHIRMLVPPTEGNDPRRAHHQRLTEAGVDVRYSSRFQAPTVIVDSRWLLVRNGSSAGNGGRPSVYLRLDSPELSRDLVSAGHDVWSRSDGSGPVRSSVAGDPRPGGNSKAPASSALRTERSARKSRNPLPSNHP